MSSQFLIWLCANKRRKYLLYILGHVLSYLLPVILFTLLTSESPKLSHIVPKIDSKLTCMFNRVSSLLDSDSLSKQYLVTRIGSRYLLRNGRVDAWRVVIPTGTTLSGLLTKIYRVEREVRSVPLLNMKVRWSLNSTRYTKRNRLSYILFTIYSRDPSWKLLTDYETV